MANIMDTISPYIDLIEGLSFVATIALVFISIKALSQIKIAKRSLRTQSIRESRKIAADYVYIYLDKIMRVKRAITIDASQVKTLESFYYSPDDDDGLDVKKITAQNKRLKLETRKQRSTYIDKAIGAYEPYKDFLNDLEAFCAGVTSGIMDEETLYRAIGLSFVNILESENLDQILFYVEQKRGRYTNIVQVFELWQLRTKVHELEDVGMEYDKLGNKLEGLRTKLKDARARTIPVIGVDFDK